MMLISGGLLLGRVGSCLRSGTVQWPGSSVKVGFFRHYFKVRAKKSEKNASLKHFLHSFINSKHSMFRFMHFYLSW